MNSGRETTANTAAATGAAPPPSPAAVWHVTGKMALWAPVLMFTDVDY